MRHFQICNPTLEVSEITEDMKVILASNLKLNIKINNTESTSHFRSQILHENKITWGQRFCFQNISQGFENVLMTLISEDDILFQCHGNLVFQQNQQLFQTEWKNNKIFIKFLLIEHADRNNQKQKQIHQNSQISEQNDIDNNKKDINPSFQQNEQQEKQLNKAERYESNYNSYQQNQNSLELAEKYASEKEKAKMLAREQIKNVQERVIRNIESNKSKMTSSNSFTPKQSKLGTQRNKENQSILHSSNRTPYDKNQDLTTNYSPKESIVKSQSFTSSIMKESTSQRKKFGDKIFENQSATTMQKSILNFSIPKGPRFNDIKYNGTQPQYNVCGSFVSKNKGTSFGFGIRKPYPQWMVKNMKEYPAPNCYTVSHSPSEMIPTSTISKGKSFGLSYKYYQKAVVNIKSNSKCKNIKLPKISKHQAPANCSFENHYHYKS